LFLQVDYSVGVAVGLVTSILSYAYVVYGDVMNVIAFSKQHADDKTSVLLMGESSSSSVLFLTLFLKEAFIVTVPLVFAVLATIIGLFAGLLSPLLYLWLIKGANMKKGRKLWTFTVQPLLEEQSQVIFDRYIMSCYIVS